MGRRRAYTIDLVALGSISSPGGKAGVCCCSSDSESSDSESEKSTSARNLRSFEPSSPKKNPLPRRHSRSRLGSWTTQSTPQARTWHYRRCAEEMGLDYDRIESTVREASIDFQAPPPKPSTPNQILTFLKNVQRHHPSPPILIPIFHHRGIWKPVRSEETNNLSLVRSHR